MQFKNLIILIILIGSFSQCSPTQNQQLTNTQRPPATKEKMVDGDCMAKCLIPRETSIVENTYIIFTGDAEEEVVDLEMKEIITQHGSSSWVKKKTDRECLSPNPNDCLVWCLVETPEEKKTIVILKDTTQSKNFVVESIGQEIITNPGGNTEWKKVLCEKDITVEVIAQVQASLKEKKFLNEKHRPVFDSQTKSALTKFQRSNGLPVGQLDFDTLDKLGVIY